MDEAGVILRDVLELEMTDAFEISLGYGFLQVSRTATFDQSLSSCAHPRIPVDPGLSRLFGLVSSHQADQQPRSIR